MNKRHSGKDDLGNYKKTIKRFRPTKKVKEWNPDLPKQFVKDLLKAKTENPIPFKLKQGLKDARERKIQYIESFSKYINEK